jgi:hypothetical protein
MTDLLALSDKILRSDNTGEKPFTRINHELSELDNGLSFVEAISNSVNLSTDDGLVIIGTSNPMAAIKSLTIVNSARLSRANFYPVTQADQRQLIGLN